MKYLSTCNAFLSLLLASNSSRALSQTTSDRRTSKVFSASANMIWALFSPNPHIFSARELYDFETNTADFFSSSISASPSFTNQKIYVTDVDVIDQVIDVDRVQSSLDVKVTLTYAGQALDDVVPLFATLFDSETMEPLLNNLSRQGMLDESTTTASIDFSPGSPSGMITKDDALDALVENRLSILLIAVGSILGVASITILCKLRNKKCDNEIKITRTEDTEESVSPGVLGANNRRVSENDLSFTPQRGIYNEYEIETPMSERSDATELSPASTSVSVNPLGIVSMRKLRGMMYTPEKRQRNDSLYNMDNVNEDC